MKPITEMTKIDIMHYQKLEQEADKLPAPCINVKRYKRSPSSYGFEAELNKEFIDKAGRYPTHDEVIACVDRGYCNFGADCTISVVNMIVTGYVYTD